MTERDAARMMEGVRRIERTMRATCLGLIMQDPGGVFITPRPGTELALMKVLEGADWKTLTLLAGEFDF